MFDNGVLGVQIAAAESGELDGASEDSDCEEMKNLTFEEEFSTSGTPFMGASSSANSGTGNGDSSRAEDDEIAVTISSNNAKNIMRTYLKIMVGCVLSFLCFWD